jgi:methionyl-tRNA formyltransferase
VYQPASFHAPAVWKEFRAVAPDLQVMAFVTLVVPAEFLGIPTRGTIQYHPSLLPRHRGRSSINWPIIQGETETGLSVFWPDAGLDTGDVLLQKRTPITETDTLGSVYFDRLFPMGVEALLEAVDLVAAGDAPRVPQDHAQATYEGPCERENARVDWGKPWRQIHDLIRGCDPAPGAWTTCGGQALQIFSSTPLPARDLADLGGAVGEVVEVSDGGFSVACADGRIRVTRVRPAGGAKLAAGEWAVGAGLTAGARLE